MKIFLMVFAFILISCNGLGPEKKVECREGEAFDQGLGKCVKSLGANALTININGFFPLEDYIASTADNDVTHSITVSDNFQNGFIPQWILFKPDGTNEVLGDGLSQVLQQSTYPAGSYRLEVRVLETTATTILDSKSWNITLTDQAVPTVVQNTAPPINTTESAGPTNINATINNPGLLANIEYEWSINDVPVPGQIGLTSAPLFATSFTFTPNIAFSYYTGLGDYKVSLTLRDTLTKALYRRSDWDVTVELAAFPTVAVGTSPVFSTTTPAETETLTLLDNTDILTGGLMFDIDASGFLDNPTEQIDLCLTASSNVGVTGLPLEVDFFADGVFVGNTNFPTPTACLLSANPVFKLLLPPDRVSETHRLTAVVYDLYTGVSPLPSYKGRTELGRFNWDVRLRKQNTPPSITINDTNVANTANDATTNLVECASGDKNSTSFTNCTITQAAAVGFDLSINISDEDFDPSDIVPASTLGSQEFRIDFLLNGQPLDGTNEFSPTNCSIPFGTIQDLSTYTCTIVLNPFSSRGPINPQNTVYVVSAQVTDDDLDSPFSGGLDNQASNIVTWQFTNVRDNNRQIAIDAGTFTTSGTPTERSTMNFDFDITDPDSDSFNVEIYNVADLSTPVLTQTVTSSDNNTTKSISLPFVVPQDTVIGAANGLIDYRLIVTDILDSSQTGLTSTTATVDLSVSTAAVTITNFNENPVFNTANFNPTIGSSLVALSGFPLTIDPGTVTDATLIDGEEIRYQWQLSTDVGATYTAIPGATERVLVWSPGPELDFATQTGTAVKLRLCVGDNGVIDGGAVSKDPTGNNTCPGGLAALDTSGGVPASAWDVTVFSNMTGTDQFFRSFRDADVPASELALWVDPRSTDPVITYMAYVATELTGTRDIIIDKIITNADGTKAGSQTAALNTLRIPFQIDDEADVVIKDLSITGDPIGDFLYLSYDTLTTAGNPTPGVRITHVKRINIGPGKLALAHQNKFGFDVNYARGGLIGFGSLISSSDENFVSFGRNAATVSQATRLKINTASTGMADISFIFSSNTTTLSAGTDYCAVACATVDATGTALRDAINAQGSADFNNITASYNLTTQEVLIFGLSLDQSLSIASNDPQSPVLTVPSRLNDPDPPGIATQLKFTTNATDIGNITFHSPKGDKTFVVGIDYCLSGCNTIDETAQDFISAVEAQSTSNFENLALTYNFGLQTVLIYGVEPGEFFSVQTNSPQSPVLTNADLALANEKPTLVRFHTDSAGTGTITLISRLNTLTFTAGVDYCFTPCTTAAATAQAFSDMLNANTNQLLENVAAFFDSDDNTVLVYGLDTFEYLRTALNLPQSPEVINPDLDTMIFHQAASNVQLTIGGLVINGGTEFCNPVTACPDEITSANNLASFINNSTDVRLQGITANHLNGSNKVQLVGVKDGNFLAAKNSSVKLGKIGINQTLGMWYIPFIDGNNSNKVSIYRGSLNDELAYSSPEIIQLDTLETDQIELAHDTDFFGTMILAVKGNGVENINVYEIDQFHNIRSQELNVFNGATVSDLRMAVSKEPSSFTPSALLTSKGAAVLVSALFKSTNQEYDLFNSVINTNLGVGFDPVANIREYETIAGLEQDQFYLATMSLNGSLELNLLEVTLDTTINDLLINCSFDNADLLNQNKCMQVRSTSSDLLFNFKPALATPLKNVTMGTEGAIEDENIQALMPIGFHIDDGDGNPDVDALAIMGLLNINATRLTADANANDGANSIIPYRPQR